MAHFLSGGVQMAVRMAIAKIYKAVMRAIRGM